VLFIEWQFVHFICYYLQLSQTKGIQQQIPVNINKINAQTQVMVPTPFVT